VNNGIIIHNLSFTNGNAKEYIVEDSVTNPCFTVHDVKEFEHFFKLVLDYTISVEVLTRFKALKKLHHVNPEFFVVHVRHNRFFINFIAADVFEFVDKIFEKVINENFLGYGFW
jgi:hypothetical protein